MPRFCVEVAGAGLACPGAVQGTSDLRVVRMILGRRLQEMGSAVVCVGLGTDGAILGLDEGRERAGAWSVRASRRLIWDGDCQARRVFWLPVEPLTWDGVKTPSPDRFVKLRPSDPCSAFHKRSLA